MKRAWITSLAMLLVACSSSPRYNSYSNYSNSYTPIYKPQASNTYVKPVAQTNYNQSNYVKTSSQVAAPAKAPITVSNFARLTYEDLVRFEPDCDKRVEQIALLEEQLRSNRFYTVDGVEGNSYQVKISKSY